MSLFIYFYLFNKYKKITEMKKFQLRLDTDSINLENEIHSNNFPLKVKNLAEHCVNYLLGEHDSNDCNDKKYNKEIHDQEIEPISIGSYDNDEINKQKIFAQIFQFKEHNFKAKEHNFKSTTRKFLF